MVSPGLPHSLSVSAVRLPDLTDEQILHTQEMSLGLVGRHARLLGVDRDLLRRRIAGSSALRTALLLERENTHDRVEIQLASSARKGEWWAIALLFSVFGTGFDSDCSEPAV